MSEKRQNVLDQPENCEKLKNEDESLSSLEKLPKILREIIYKKLNVEDLKNLFATSKKLVTIFECVIQIIFMNIFFRINNQLNESEVVMKKIVFVCQSDCVVPITRKYRNLRIAKIYKSLRYGINYKLTDIISENDKKINFAIIESLHLSDCLLEDISELEIALKSFTNLNELHLEKCYQIKKNGNISDTLTSNIKYGTSLKTFKIEESNSNRYNEEVYSLKFEEFFKSHQNLEEISIKMISFHMESFQFDSIDFKKLKKFTLTIDPPGSYSVKKTIDLSTFLRKCLSTLEEVSLIGTLSRETYEVLLKMSYLKTLTLMPFINTMFNNNNNNNNEQILDLSSSELNNSIEILTIKLSELIFPFITKLSKVKVFNVVDNYDREYWKTLSGNMTQLETINFNAEHRYNHNKYLTGLKFPSVKHVAFKGKYTSSIDLSQITEAFPNLETLELDRYYFYFLDKNYLEFVEDKSKKLKHFKIYEGIKIETDRFLTHFKDCSNLRSIVIPRDSICLNLRQPIMKSIEEVLIIQKMASTSQKHVKIDIDRSLLLPLTDDRNEEEETFMKLETFPDEIFEEICLTLNFKELKKLMMVSKRFVC